MEASYSARSFPRVLFPLYVFSNVHVLPLRLVGLRLGPCSLIPGTRRVRELPFFSSHSPVWVPHLGPQSNSGHLDMSSRSTPPFPWLAYMHSYVRRNVLLSNVGVHGGRLPWQLHRRHGYGAPRAEGCPSIQRAVCCGRFGPNDHCTFHYPTTPRKVIRSFDHKHFPTLTIT